LPQLQSAEGEEGCSWDLELQKMRLHIRGRSLDTIPKEMTSSPIQRWKMGRLWLEGVKPRRAKARSVRK